MSWQGAALVLCGVLLVICFAAVLWKEHKTTRDQYAQFDPRVGRDVYRFVKGVHR